jgi:hypothetical protein
MNRVAPGVRLHGLSEYLIYFEVKFALNLGRSPVTERKQYLMAGS